MLLWGSTSESGGVCFVVTPTNLHMLAPPTVCSYEQRPGEAYHLSCWDFAGQRALHNTSVFPDYTVTIYGMSTVSYTLNL